MVAAGKSATVINRYALEHVAYLIIIGSHTRDSETGSIDSTAKHVSQQCDIPTLVVPNSVQ